MERFAHLHISYKLRVAFLIFFRVILAIASTIRFSNFVIINTRSV